MQASIVTPVGNEAKTLDTFLRQMDEMVARVPHDVVCHMTTDTKGRDDSPRILWGAQEKYSWLDHSHIRAVELAGAYIHGYKLALEAGADYIIEFDVGHPMRMLPCIMAGLLDSDAVFCTRFLVSGGYLGPWQRRWISRLSTVFFNLWLGMNLSDATSGLHGFRKEVLHGVDFDSFISRGHDFQSELKYVVGMKTDRIREIPFVYEVSESSFNPKQLISAAKTLLNLRKVHGCK